MTESNFKRIQILTSDEINEIYELPSFNHAEREEYFSLDKQMLGIVRKLDKIESKIYFILLIGYFRAKPAIPKFQLKDVKGDVRYLCKRYFSSTKPSFNALLKTTRSTLVNKMLSTLGFSRLTKAIQVDLLVRLQDVATICTEPRYIFDECLAFFGQRQIALSGYTTIQDLVTEALSTERQRTELILSQEMSKNTVEELNNVLNKKGFLNSLSAYKGSARDYSPSEIDKELHTHQTIKEMYPELKALISSLELSQGNMAYYASIIQHGSIYKVRRFPKWQSLLYLVCYLYFRYRDTNDKLITSFCYLVRKHNEAAKASAKQRVSEEIEVVRKKLKCAGNILKFFVDDDISDKTEFGDIRQDAFAVISKDELQLISKHLTENDFDLIGYQWEYTDKQARKTANSLRRLFIAIDIECDASQKILADQISSSKAELDTERKLKTTDRNLIRKSDIPYLINEEQVDIKRFEFYLYSRVFKMLDVGKVYVTESEKNKRLEDDLLTNDDWLNKQSIINKTGLYRLIAPINQTLIDLETQLNAQIERVTVGISEDANDFVKQQPRSKQLAWSLANKRWKEDVDNPIYSQIQHMGIIEIMNYVNRKTGFLSAFNNISSRKSNIRAKDDDLIACLFGNGANYGIYKIATVSDRSIGTLRTVNDSFVRPETTGSANDYISNAIAKLPIFKHYTIDETAPFGSIDGQKHTCRINTFKARFSAKYFRKGKGVSAMTLVSNHVPLNTTIIAPNEYEGHFAFDLLYNNSSDIQPKSLATDTHGVNNVNFAILDIFGYKFAPRYAKFKRAFNDQFEVILGDELKICLKKPINTKLIEQEWDKIQHIICSLSRKATKQSTVIKKLSNSKRNTRTLSALREYDRLIKCQYLLEYVDNKTLRHFVQQALNRGEAYHQLRRAIASVNGNQFRGGNDYQIEQWNDCARLIANCIIYYNSALLSSLVEKFEKDKNQDAVDMLINLSPVAWAHIQLAGNYNFGEQTESFNLEMMLEHVDPLIQNEEDT